MIAVLYVQRDGTYASREGVECWDELADARLYGGPYPIVAHPPCQRWGKLAKACYGRYKKESLRPGNDGGCFESALENVRRFGGVLEHPAGSMAWEHYNLTRPEKGKWTQMSEREWVCEVWQSAYGHKANKATWLFYCGIVSPREMKWERPRGTHQVGFQDKRGKRRNKPTLSPRDASATPVEFRDVLLGLAKSCRGNQ